MIISVPRVVCDELNVRCERQKQLLPWGEGWETDRRKKNENEGMRENKVSLCTHLLFNQKQRKQVLQGREGLLNLPSSLPLHSHPESTLVPSCTFLSKLSLTGPLLLLGTWWRSRHSSSGVPPGQGRATSPRPRHHSGSS